MLVPCICQLLDYLYPEEAESRLGAPATPRAKRFACALYRLFRWIPVHDVASKFGTGCQRGSVINHTHELVGKLVAKGPDVIRSALHFHCFLHMSRAQPLSAVGFLASMSSSDLRTSSWTDTAIPVRPCLLFVFVVLCALPVRAFCLSEVAFCAFLQTWRSSVTVLTCQYFRRGSSNRTT